ncbi:hypothetical protein [Demequina aurantiaca]|uniref:hypothetical protein n=1 Tax=Demequina aurantiaca TaxID=676200 RepID=UPI000A4E87C9|nr:hypothetical protein [Demequina aurantiaca]
MERLVIASAGALSLIALLCACGPANVDPQVSPASNSPGVGNQAAIERIDDIETAVAVWRDAGSIAEARAAAETALNLVVGTDGPNYGDADGDGKINGAVDEGLLPGLAGEPGLAQTPPVSACVEADVLGGSWEDPQGRWAQALAAVDAWTPTKNTMPALASHPQRVFGWASLTLASDDLDEAHEYAGHAQIHVDVSRHAFEDCT